MILISHRGNLTGKNPERENHPDYIKEALDLGFDVVTIRPNPKVMKKLIRYDFFKNLNPEKP